jgi:hypothetical protein
MLIWFVVTNVLINIIRNDQNRIVLFCKRNICIAVVKIVKRFLRFFQLEVIKTETLHCKLYYRTDIWMILEKESSRCPDLIPT